MVRPESHGAMPGDGGMIDEEDEKNRVADRGRRLSGY